jgi:hypothetical protein
MRLRLAASRRGYVLCVVALECCRKAKDLVWRSDQLQNTRMGFLWDCGDACGSGVGG